MFTNFVFEFSGKQVFKILTSHHSYVPIGNSFILIGTFSIYIGNNIYLLSQHQTDATTYMARIASVNGSRAVASKKIINGRIARFDIDPLFTFAEDMCTQEFWLKHFRHVHADKIIGKPYTNMYARIASCSTYKFHVHERERVMINDTAIMEIPFQKMDAIGKQIYQETVFKICNLASNHKVRDTIKKFGRSTTPTGQLLIGPSQNALYVVRSRMHTVVNLLYPQIQNYVYSISNLALLPYNYIEVSSLVDKEAFDSPVIKKRITGVKDRQELAAFDTYTIVIHIVE